jgi:hypothetical protein
MKAKSLTEVLLLIQDVNSKEAFYAEINFGISTYPIGALKYYSLDLFSPGSNIVMNGYFTASLTQFYYVGQAKTIT